MKFRLHQKTEGNHPERALLLGPLGLLACQKKTWSPRLLPGVLLRALANPECFREILRVLVLPECAELARTFPRFPFKLLTHDYLARSFTVETRASCFVHHYLWLHENMPNKFIRSVLYDSVPLADIDIATHHIGFVLGSCGSRDKEGELSLHLEMDRDRVFSLSFSIVPGKAVQAQADNVLLITQIQGMRGKVHQISLIYRIMHGAGPPSLLLSALQGFGSALGIDTLACVSGQEQSSYCEGNARSFQAMYDDFCTVRGLARGSSGLFLAPIPMPEKPLELFPKPSLKRRAERRRELKRLIRETIREALRAVRRGSQSGLQQIHIDSEPSQVAPTA